MKKLLFLAAFAVTVISCERGIDNVTNNETPKFEKKAIKKHEKNSSKTASDTITVQNISSAAGSESTTEPIDDVDPNDIKTPPRK
ncbi:hypothetical protein [Chryseobacterium flavum]|uniref:hypothetical protein n=1 Tax=Chryseobacterium flavum TaxID=415851 RepID=UPI0028AF42C4|nr:hypothetical protein [Chryseobacterium flavum]